jgi:predicted HAD superfamily Cof-like phosphohydrolase
MLQVETTMGITVNMYKDVTAFCRKFQLRPTRKPFLLPYEKMDVRLRHLEEELSELSYAYTRGNEAEVIDALVDLVYVALGTAYLCGFPFMKVWDAVHAANMKKVRVRKASESKRGSTFDVGKPADWKKPDVAKILRRTRDNDN